MLIIATSAAAPRRGAARSQDRTGIASWCAPADPFAVTPQALPTYCTLWAAGSPAQVARRSRTKCGATVVLLHRSTVDLVCHHTFPYVDSNTMNSNVAGKVAMLPSERLYKAEWKAIDHPSTTLNSYMQEITRACSYAYRHATDVPKQVSSWRSNVT
jgi:hypothetical protein